MNLKVSNLPLIWFKLGPPHLYETSAKYYLLDLLTEHNIILFASLDYKKHPRVSLERDLVGKGEVKVIYYSKCRSIQNAYSCLRSLSQQISRLNSYSPYTVYSVDLCYPETHIILLLSYKSNKKRSIVLLQTSTMLRGKDLSIVNADRISSWTEQFKTNLKTKLRLQIPTQVAKTTYRVYAQLRDFLSYKVIPLLLTGRSACTYFSPTLLQNYPANLLKDYQKNTLFVVFSQVAIASAHSYGFSNVQLKPHPAIKHYLSFTSRPSTYLILPDYRKLRTIYDLTENQVNCPEAIANCLYKLVSLIFSVDINSNITIKFHPRVTADPEWKSVIDLLQQTCPLCRLTCDECDAQSLIASSSIIIGETSSALEWSSFVFPHKLTISHNIYAYPSMHTFSSDSDSIYTTHSSYQLSQLLDLHLTNK